MKELREAIITVFFCVGEMMLGHVALRISQLDFSQAKLFAVCIVVAMVMLAVVFVLVLYAYVKYEEKIEELKKR